MKRRDFLKTAILSAASAGFLGSFLKSTKAFALELIDMSGKRKDAANISAIKVASGLNYVEDLDKALKLKKIKKEDRVVGDKTYKPEDQACDTCNFYKKTKDNAGTCLIIPGVLVHAKGSCVSWTQKV